MEDQKNICKGEKNLSRKILLMRHARSTYNYQWDQQYELHENNKIDQETFRLRHKELTSSADPDLINAKVDQEGLRQCEEAAKVIPEKFPNIKRVLISPLRRTIKTFEESFKNHPNFQNKKMTVSFIEEMRENINDTCDIACWTKNELECLRLDCLYDWSWQDAYPEDIKPLWFLESMDKAVKKRVLKAIEGCSTTEEKRLKFQKNLIDGPWFPDNYEPWDSAFERIKTAQEKISKIIQEENLQDNELAIVSHFDTQSIFTKYCGVKEENSDYIGFENAELREFELKLLE